MSVLRALTQAGLALLVFATALGGIAATPSAACACSTRAPVYISRMQAPLREIFEGQVWMHADSGRFASRTELEAGGWQLPPGTENLTEFVVTDSTVRAVTREPSYFPDGACTLAMRRGDAFESGEHRRWITCTGLPDIREGEREAIYVYVGVVLLAAVVRLAVAGRSQPPVGLATLGGFLALALLHPLWFLVEQPSWCDEGVRLAYLWVAFVVAYMLRTAFFGNYEPPQAPRPPRPPRGGSGGRPRPAPASAPSP